MTMNNQTKKYDSSINYDDPIFYNDPDWIIDYQTTKLSNDFMKKFKHLINWSLIARKYSLDTSFMMQMIDFLPLHIIFKFQKLDHEFIQWIIESQPENIDWNMLSSMQKLNHQIITKYIDFLNLESIIRYQDLEHNTIQYIHQYIIKELKTLDLSDLNNTTIEKKFENLIELSTLI